MSIFPLGGCLIPSRTTLDKRGSFSVHLYQKDLKLVNKWLSCGIFPERLRDSLCCSGKQSFTMAYKSGNFKAFVMLPL